MSPPTLARNVLLPACGEKVAGRPGEGLSPYFFRFMPTPLQTYCVV